MNRNCLVLNRRRALKLLLGTAAVLGTSALPLTAAHAQSRLVWAANSGECDPEDIVRFYQQSGISVDYREVIADADQFFASMRPQLEAGLASGYDLVCISSIHTAFWVQNNWLEPLDTAALPHVQQNLLPSLKSVAHADIAVPFDFAPVGLAFSRRHFQAGLHSWGQLLEPALRGKVGLYPTAVVNIAAWGLYLRAQGKIDHPPASMTLEEAKEVLAFLKPHIESRQLLPAQGESAGQKLSSGDWVAAMAPPVNISQLNPAQVGFAVPDEGAPAYVDRLGIPKGSRNPQAALAFIDWWFQPENAASFCRYTLQYPYAKGVREVLAEKEPELAANPLIFPSAAVLERLFPYPAPWDMRERAQIARIWTRMVSG